MGNDIEGIAHLDAYSTYQRLCKLYDVKNVNKEMMDSIKNALMDERSWEKNDESVEWWRFNLDGTIEDDDTNYVSRQIVDSNGNYVYEKIEGSEFTGSKAAALVDILGEEYVLKCLGSNYDDINDFDIEVICEATGYSPDQVNYMKQHPELMKTFMENDSNRKKIYGNQLLVNSGFVEVDGRWIDRNKYDNVNLKIKGLENNSSLAIARNENGTYNLYTVDMAVFRDSDAFQIYKNGKTNLSDTTVDQRDNSDVAIIYTDLRTKESKYVSYNNGLTTIDRISGTSVEIDGNTYTGNTIISDFAKMHLQEGYDKNKTDYNITKLGVLTNATTLSGIFIQSDGTGYGEDKNRWLFHPMANCASSAGCFGFMGDKVKTPGVEWNNPNDPTTGTYKFNEMIKKLNELGVYDGYNIGIKIHSQNVPGRK